MQREGRPPSPSRRRIGARGIEAASGAPGPGDHWSFSIGLAVAIAIISTSTDQVVTSFVEQLRT